MCWLPNQFSMGQGTSLRLLHKTPSKYTPHIDKADAGHLFSAIKAKYPLKIDWEANTYLGINFEWRYDEGYVILSMKGYIKKALKE